jgi:membrane fusion protein, copper/silver efflux system
MKLESKPWLLAAACLVVAILGWALISRQASSSGAAGQRKIKYYQDSMHPHVKSDAPGKCTICGMDLTPVYEGEAGFGANIITLSSNNIQVIHVQTDEVRRRTLRRTLRVAGTMLPNDALKRVVFATTQGRIDQLAVPYAGFDVVEGQRLVSFYSANLLTEKRRYIALVRQGGQRGGQSQVDSPDGLAAVAAQTLRLYGLTDAQVKELAVKPDVNPYFDILSPINGTVIERSVYDGQYVTEGEKLFTIADLSSLWFQFDVYERELAWIALGQKVELVTPAVPDKVYVGPIIFIDPVVSEPTRSAKVRVEVANPLITRGNHKQREMFSQSYAEGRVQADVPDVLTVAKSAILMPGPKAFAYIDRGGGNYEARQVRVARQGDEFWEVRDGLDEGDRVVTTGSLLVDSQAQFSQTTRGEDIPESSTKAPAEEHHDMASTPSAPDMAAHTDTKAMLTESQTKALQAFFTTVDAMSQALAADNLSDYQKAAAKLPTVLPPLAVEIKEGHAWRWLVDRLNGAAPQAAAADLAKAREGYVPFSAVVVDLAKQARQQAEPFRLLKIYHCPMAPKPGLWLQLKGPLRNPFFGAEMLTCGSEVKL